jgi:chitinase
VWVTRVEFYDGGILKGNATDSPYRFAWLVTSADNGTHSWTAKAYDAAANSSVSSPVSLTVNIAAADTTPPACSVKINGDAPYTGSMAVTLALTALGTNLNTKFDSIASQVASGS